MKTILSLNCQPPCSSRCFSRSLFSEPEFVKLDSWMMKTSTTVWRSCSLASRSPNSWLKGRAEMILLGRDLTVKEDRLARRPPMVAVSNSLGTEQLRPV